MSRHSCARLRLGAGALISWSLLALLAGVTQTAAAETDPEAGTPGRSGPERPNVVLFMTDDQNRNELEWMPKTRSLLGGHGVTFAGALSPAPLCCPARAMTMTGQYGQNNGVQHNRGEFGGFASLQDRGNTLGAWLSGAGYQTALLGKYLNGYKAPTPIQRGWTHWRPSVDRIYSYNDTVFLEDDHLRTYRRNVTPLLADFTDEYVRELSATGDPFFIWVNHVSPHVASTRRDDSDSQVWGPPKPTYRYRESLSDVVAPSLSKPSFNRLGFGQQPYSSNVGKRPRATLQSMFTGRIRSLQDVDDAVERLVDVLTETGELAETYIFFVSDNGYLLGEHQRDGKNVLYREALEIPLVVRVPAAEQGTTSATPVSIVDLAPTIVELTGVTPGRVMDGQSFVPSLRGEPQPWRDSQLIQTGSARVRGPQPGWATRGVRTERFTYIRRTGNGGQFLFDRLTDPHEMDNLAGDPAYDGVLAELRRRHDALISCTGVTCNQSFGPLPGVRG